MNETNTIAIVGGGAVGVSVLHEAIDQISRLDNSESYQVYLYEKSGKFGTGLAYGTNISEHILNMAASTMSAVADKPTHFQQWLNKFNGSSLLPYSTPTTSSKDYVPRKVFGYYLKDTFNAALAKADSQGIRVTVFSEEVKTISEDNNRTVITSNVQNRPFHQVILCLGNHPPTNFTHLTNRPGYLNHAWPEERIIKSIPTYENVYIIGSGLTAIDTYITLEKNNHKGTITFISRSGLLPKVRVLEKPHKLSFLNRKLIDKHTNNNKLNLTLKDVTKLISREFKTAKILPRELSKLISNLSKPVTEILKNDIKMAEREEVRYFSILKALDEEIAYIWKNLEFNEKKRFDDAYKTLWNVFDYPMPLINARKILSALETGQLSVVPSLSSIEYDHQENIFKLICKNYKNSSTNIVYKGKYLINASGQGLNAKKINNPIIKSGLANGIICSHPLGGIDVDFETGATKNSDGKNSEFLYMVGSLTRGVHFYTNSINENAKCGKRTVSEVISKLKRRDKEKYEKKFNYAKKNFTNENRLIHG